MNDPQQRTSEQEGTKADRNVELLSPEARAGLTSVLSAHDASR